MFICATPASDTDHFSVSWQLDSTSVQPVTTVRNFEVHLDADVIMRAPVTAGARACFATVRQTRSVRHCLSRAALTMIRSLVLFSVKWITVIQCSLVLVSRSYGVFSLS